MNQKVKLIVGLAALAALVGLAAWFYQSLSRGYKPEDIVAPSSVEGQSESSEPQRVEAPDFTMTDAEGNSVKLSDFEGKPVVLNFWASWCPPCKGEMPEFEKLWKEMGDDVSFIMLNATDGGRETEEKARKYIAEQGFEFPVYYDLGQGAAYVYGISSLPTTLFIDREGYLVTGRLGMVDEAYLRKGIAQIQAVSESISATDASDERTNPSWCAMDPQYLKITAEDAHRLMGEFETYTILDVRTASEYAEKRIDGAVLIPDTEIEARAETELPDKREVIFVYCRSGRRSEDAAKKLVEMGYNHVYDFGGINDWPYDTVSG